MLFTPSHFNGSNELENARDIIAAQPLRLFAKPDSMVQHRYWGYGVPDGLVDLLVLLDVFADKLGRRKDNMHRTVQQWLISARRVESTYVRTKHNMCMRVDDFQLLCKYMVVIQKGRSRQQATKQTIVAAAGPWSGWVPWRGSKTAELYRQHIPSAWRQDLDEDLVWELPSEEVQSAHKEVVTIPASLSFDRPFEPTTTLQETAELLGCSVQHTLRVIRQRKPDFKEADKLSYAEVAFLSMIIGKSTALRISFFDALWHRAINPVVVPSMLGLPDFTNPATAARAWADSFDREVEAVVGAAKSKDVQVEMMAQLSTEAAALKAELTAKETVEKAYKHAVATTVARGADIKDLQKEDGTSTLGIEELVTTAEKQRANGYISLEEFTRGVTMPGLLEASVRAEALHNARNAKFAFVKFCFFRKYLRADGKYVKREAFADDVLVQVRRVKIPDHAVLARQARYGTRQDWAWSFWFSIESLTWFVRHYRDNIKAWEQAGAPAHAQPRGAVPVQEEED